jgi:hypothetical protein
VQRTRHLEALLGSDFQVLNLALPGCHPFEFGAPAAEVLSRDFPRLLLITNTPPGPDQLRQDPDGMPQLRYFFWEARRRGLLHASAPREERLREAERKGHDESFREMQDQLRLDLRLHFRDLWNTVTCRWVSTVWCPRLVNSWLKPRAAYPDDWEAPPAEEKNLQAAGWYYMSLLRIWVEAGRPFVPPPGVTAWRPPVSLVETNLAACLPAEFHNRTLVLVNHASPYFVRQLTADERRVYEGLHGPTVRAYARAGVTAVEVGRDLAPRHYWDWLHLNKEGGRLLAEEVAPHVRALARRNWPNVGRAGPDGK